MKIAHLFTAAGLAIASLGVASTADAKDHGRGHEYRDDRGGGDWGRGYDRREYRHDNGNHYGWRNGRGHQRCFTRWEHHREVRICR